MLDQHYFNLVNIAEQTNKHYKMINVPALQKKLLKLKLKSNFIWFFVPLGDFNKNTDF